MRFFVVGFAVLALASAGVVPVDYLPPVQEVAALTGEYLPPVAVTGVAEEPTILADDGYRYKTVKKLRHRRRRDVHEIVNDYLPPAQESVFEIAAGPVAEVTPVLQSGLLTDDGYRYKTVKKLRLRHRRDVNELVNEYLPPGQETVIELAAGPVAEVAPVLESGLLADDGYRYKTVKKLRLRHRRDVNQIVNEYLPPAQESVIELAAGPVAEIAPVLENGLLADDGYRYKTVKRLRLRHRRDVNEIVNEYLPPAQESFIELAAGQVAEVAPILESGLLADDGYRYKTVKKLRLRHRRDVNQIVNEYLPPAEELIEVAAPVAELGPVIETAGLAADGYRYKTVKKLRYRHRY